MSTDYLRDQADLIIHGDPSKPKPRGLIAGTNMRMRVAVAAAALGLKPIQSAPTVLPPTVHGHKYEHLAKVRTPRTRHRNTAAARRRMQQASRKANR